MTFAAVLLYGIPNTWRIVGVIHSKRDYLQTGYTVSPTPETHPVLSNKIQNLFELLTQRNAAKQNAAKQNAKKLAEIEQATIDFQSFNSSSNENSSSGASTPIHDQTASDNSSIPNGEFADSAAETDQTDLTNPNTRKSSLQKSSRVKVTAQRGQTNIPISVDVSKNMNIPQLPIPNLSGQLWLMLKITDDFTHIWFPHRKKFLSAKLIQFSLEMAGEKKKTVLITQTSFHPQVYATPVERNKIFIGPYKKKADMNLALFRRVDGRLVLLDHLEKQNNSKLQNRSTGKNRILLHLSNNHCAGVAH